MGAGASPHGGDGNSSGVAVDGRSHNIELGYEGEVIIYSHHPDIAAAGHEDIAGNPFANDQHGFADDHLPKYIANQRLPAMVSDC